MCLAIMLTILSLTLLADRIHQSEAHQDPCHRLHICPSDRKTYVCGDRGAVSSARLIPAIWPESRVCHLS
jgi:hypothetical protein